MTKVEINGKTYCVETLIYTVERLTKDVKANAEYHRLVLDKIRAEIEKIPTAPFATAYTAKHKALEIIDHYKERGE